jgi:hypothetical protein
LDIGEALNVESADFWLGMSAVAGVWAFDGYMDEVVIFNRILTDDEIDEIRGGTFGAGGGDIFHSPIFGGTVLP